MLSCKNLSKPFVESIMRNAMNLNKVAMLEYYKGRTLVNAFFEVSTRTSLSFESSMYRLGGNVMTFNKNVSSISKGESDEDTIKTLENYGDIMVIRHPKKGFVQEMAKRCNIPVINGGDGDGEHPTQALLDLYTIYKKFPLLSNLNILFIGDIKHSRSIHSLIDLLKLYPSNKIYFLPFINRGLEINNVYNIGLNHGQNVEDMILTKDTVDISKFDVIYCTRMQKERCYDGECDIIIDKHFMENAKADSILMHPLPRNIEISIDMDNDKRSVYFEQVKNGVEIRTALIDYILDNHKRNPMLP